MIPSLLVALALVDAMFCGFRDAAGRNLAIDKRAYFRRAIARGLAAGALAVVLLAAFAALLITTAPVPAAVYSDMISAGATMVWIFATYATLVFAALLAYLVPSTDVSTLATVIVLGPFTMLRPWVVAAGAIAAALTAREPRTAVLALVAGAVLASLERLLGRARRRGVAKA